MPKARCSIFRMAPNVDLNGKPTTRIFDLLGLKVVADATGTVFAGLDLASLADNDVVEVSGLFDATGTLQATYIEKKGTLQPATTVEVKGTASGVAANSFNLGIITVNIGGSTDQSGIPGGVLNDGQSVEANGIWVDGNTIDATHGKVELEDRLVGNDGDKLSLEGIVSDYVDDSDFKVAGIPVDIAMAVREPMNLTLADGLRVQVAGTVAMSGGVNVLNASAIKTRSNGIEVHARISAAPGITIDNDNLNEGGISVLAGDGVITAVTNSGTLLEDKTPRDATPPLSLSELAAGDFVSIGGYVNDSGDFVATEVRRDYPDETMVQAPVDSDNGTNSITLLGVTFLTGSDTEFEDENQHSVSPATFYSLVNNGDLVKVEDSGADGTADEIKRRN